MPALHFKQTAPETWSATADISNWERETVAEIREVNGLPILEAMRALSRSEVRMLEVFMGRF
jgi:hypothetical protein